MDIKQIIQKHRNKAENKPETRGWDDLVSIIEGKIKEDIALIVKDFDKKLAGISSSFEKEITNWGKELQKKAEQELGQHIRTRKIEIKGDKGDSPVKGKDYFDGYTPVKNKDYFDGKDAEVDYEKITRLTLSKIGDLKDKADELVKKINSSKEKITMSSIKNLQEELELIKKNIRETARGGGVSKGGMGIWVHQQFNLTSATTSVSLSNNISANGTAHLFRYQGQMLAMNKDYTISGKVVSLLFTPVDGTVFDATYVRT